MKTLFVFFGLLTSILTFTLAAEATTFAPGSTCEIQGKIVDVDYEYTGSEDPLTPPVPPGVVATVKIASIKTLDNREVACEDVFSVGENKSIYVSEKRMLRFGLIGSQISGIVETNPEYFSTYSIPVTKLEVGLIATAGVILASGTLAISRRTRR